MLNGAANNLSGYVESVPLRGAYLIQPLCCLAYERRGFNSSDQKGNHAIRDLSFCIFAACYKSFLVGANLKIRRHLSAK